jgi:urease accessory protein UreF
VNREPLNENYAEPAEAARFLGECHPLLDQLGSADGLFTLSGVAAALQLPEVDSPRALESFLSAYLSQILVPLELPAIYQAHHHASHNQARELLACDCELTRRAPPPQFARASQRVGRDQLRRLRPLRDERIIQRYLEAVEQERAQAWHTLVYGVTLAVYSLPVRQGLLTYARQTLAGFIQAAARPLRLSAEECAGLLNQSCAELPAHLEKLLQEPPQHFPE